MQLVQKRERRPVPTELSLLRTLAFIVQSQRKRVQKGLAMQEHCNV